MFGLPSGGAGESVLGKPSIFAKPNEENDDNDEVEVPDEAPIYAEGGNSKVEFKKGVEI